MKNTKNKYISIAFLQAIIVVYTLSGIAAKFASGFEFLSFEFIACYGAEIFALGIYAILWQQVLKKFDKVIVPSENTKKLFNEVYNDLDIEVVEHGIDYKKYENTRTFEPNNEFNVAFVGAMAIHKGSLILKDLIKKGEIKMNEGLSIVPMVFVDFKWFL